MYKGILKVLLAIVTGLEISVSNSGLGGLSSAFRLLEISHTHFWTKDLLDNVQHGLSPNSLSVGNSSTGGNSSDVSQYGSRENLDQPDSMSSNYSYPSMGDATNPPSLETPRPDPDSSQLLRHQTYVTA